MAFLGEYFKFDGVSCEDYDLMIYEINNTAMEATKFASIPNINEAALPRKWKPVFYGVTFEKKLEFSLVFGVNQERLDAGQYLSRQEMDAIATWLTGHDEYKWLTITQDDMAQVRYKCFITGLEMIEYGRIPWAMKATVICDSPYAYMYPKTYTYLLNGTTTITFKNEASLNGYYYPKIIFEPKSGGNLTIKNQSDGDREFKFTGIPAAVTSLTVDNENMVITNSADLDMYSCFNHKYFRLKHGNNALQITGVGTLKIICEFPVNVGG